MKKTEITVETSRHVVISRSSSIWEGNSESTGPRVPTQEEFDSLLAYLAADRDEAGKEYETIRRKLIKFFECRGCSSPEDHADETINRVARKIRNGTEIWAKQPSSYFYGVARNVLMDYRRRLSKEALPLDSVDKCGHLCGSPLEKHESRQRERRLEHLLKAVQAYLQELPAHRRDLILEYYGEDNTSKGESRRLLAKRLGIPANALRIRIHRIRMKLRARFREYVDEIEC